MSTATATATGTKKRKTPTRREGERHRIALTKGDATLSFSISPSAYGYTLRARTKAPSVGTRLATEHFKESDGDSYEHARKRSDELVKAALAKGWTKKQAHQSIEDLL